MDSVRKMSLLAVQVAAVSFCLPTALLAAEREPSIEEMWAKIKTQLDPKSPARKGVSAAPKESGQTERGDRAKAAAPRKAIDFGPLLKRLNTRTQESIDMGRRERDDLSVASAYMRLEAFEKAANVLVRALRQQRSTAQWHGWMEATYAVAMAHLGRQQVAERYVPLSEKVLEATLLRDEEEIGQSDVRDLKRAHKFVREYPGARKRLAKVTASLAAEPSADKQWEFVGLCDAEHGGARFPVKWLLGIHEMRVLYPDHEVNRGDASDRMLARAYRFHNMYEECIEHVTQVLKDKPATLEYISKGYAHFDRAFSQELLARHYARIRDRQRALAGYRKAIELYREFMRELPDCYYTRPQEDGDPSYVERRIRAVQNAIASLRGRRRFERP